MTIKRTALALIFIGLLSLVLYPYAAAAEPSVYRVLVDDWYGFYKVSEVNHTPFNYENQTLNLNVGDTVIWVNDASDNYDLTILSAQNLWDSKIGYLKYNYRSFNYTFTKPGTYEIYVKEYPRRPHQTIIVAPVETPTVTTPPPTPTETETVIATVAQTPQTTSPEFSLMYILMAFILIAGIVVLMLLNKK
jgi:plastocyanin